MARFEAFGDTFRCLFHRTDLQFGQMFGSCSRLGCQTWRHCWQLYMESTLPIGKVFGKTSIAGGDEHGALREGEESFDFWQVQESSLFFQEGLDVYLLDEGRAGLVGDWLVPIS